MQQFDFRLPAHVALPLLAFLLISIFSALIGARLAYIPTPSWKPPVAADIERQGWLNTPLPLSTMSASGPGIPVPRSSVQDRSASGSHQGQGYHGQGRRAPSTSSVASSSGTVHSSARGSVSTSAGGAGAKSGGGMAAHLETTVTKLLVATKQLLEGLTDWSQGRITEEQVSDIYVRLGNCFNAAVAAFTKEGISMRYANRSVHAAFGYKLASLTHSSSSTETSKRFLLS